MAKKITTEEFINHAKEIHGDKYNYSKVEYINNNTKKGNIYLDFFLLEHNIAIEYQC